MWLPVFAPALTGIWSSLRGARFVAPKQYKEVNLYGYFLRFIPKPGQAYKQNSR